MKSSQPLRFFAATAIALTLVNHWGIDLTPTQSNQWIQGDRAEARRGSSGGRSGGGSFGRSSPSRSRSTSPSRSSTRRSSGSSGYSSGGYSSGGYSSGAGGSVPMSPGLMMLLLLVSGSIAIGLLVYMILKQSSQRSSTPAEELDNDVVTITKIQVALLAQARQIQTELTQLTEAADTATPEGLSELMQESVLALLRSPQYWTHVSASSETLQTREAASQAFEQISIEERSRFSAETLVNVGGRIRRQALQPATDEIASYIVVTLLIGSAADRAIINPDIHTTEELKTALQSLGGITSNYLMVFELLWSPQDAADSLSQDELISEYPHLKLMI